MMIEFAARQGDPVAHSKKFSWGVIGAIAGGIACGVLLFVFPPAGLAALAAGAEVTTGAVVVGTAAAVSTTAAGISGGKALGEVVGSYQINPNAGDIADGSPTVATGLGQPRAARMSSPLRCHPGDQVATGSDSVFIDPPEWPASRKLDYTSCGGQISDGCPTVLIGGNPVKRVGTEIKERPGTGYKVTFLVIDIVGTAAGLVQVPENLARWGTNAWYVNASQIAKIAGAGVKVETWTDVPTAKTQDATVSPVLKGISAASDIATGRMTPDKIVKAGADVVGAGSKGTALIGGTPAPKVPTIGSGGP